jgi:hypothetical protein
MSVLDVIPAKAQQHQLQKESLCVVPMAAVKGISADTELSSDKKLRSLRS